MLLHKRLLCRSTAEQFDAWVRANPLPGKPGRSVHQAAEVRSLVRYYWLVGWECSACQTISLNLCAACFPSTKWHDMSGHYRWSGYLARALQKQSHKGSPGVTRQKCCGRACSGRQLVSGLTMSRASHAWMALQVCEHLQTCLTCHTRHANKGA